MDAFETIRIIAARLHGELVSGGANPLEPMSLVNAAIDRFKLELIFVDRGNVVLKGARAVFDGQSGTICAEDVGTDADRALLLGHEIGHSAVHGKSSCCSDDDIDPSRSTESAPVSLQKVEDYGVRERRELEANVFAREFLLPRPVARRLYLDEGKSASDICAATGLPVPLVRQQLLDVLLLPEIVPEEKKPVTQFAKDPEQEAAAFHRNSPYLLRAGPGTGKTRTLVRRVETLMAEGIDPSAMLALTFSNRTAGELSERLTKAMGEQAASMWVGTFHGFGLDLVRRFHDKLKLPPNPTLFDRSDAIAVLEQILPTLPLVHYKNLWDPVVELREVLQGISRAKDEVVTATEYLRLAREMADSVKPGDEKSKEIAEQCLEIASVYTLYEEAKKERGAVDFGDLIMLPVLLMEQNEAVRNSVRLRHRHILVDEYQDVNRASVRLVKQVAGDGKNLWTVGDARQSIYRFRGASSANMTSFGTDFLDATLGQLGLSYRSTQKVLDTFGKFSAGMPLSKELANLPLTAVRGAGTAMPEVRILDNPDDEAAGIAASVRELETAGVALRDQAVLCRTNDRVADIAQALEERGIPVLHLGSLFERDEIRNLLSILSLAADRLGAGLVRIAALSRYAIPAQDVKLLIAHLQDRKDYALARLVELSGLSGLSTSGAQGMARLAADLKGAKPSAAPWDLLCTYLLDRTDIIRARVAASGIGDRMRAIAIWQFLNFLRDQSPVSMGSPVMTLLDRVRNLVLLAEERDLRQVPDAALQINAVRLMTIHGSKGLEFDAVHIPGLVKTGIPANFSGLSCPVPEKMIEGAVGEVRAEAELAHKQEQECLFFVAMSRAKTHLHLYSHRLQPNGKTRNPSDYLSRLAGTVITNNSPDAIRLPPKPVERVNLTIGKDWERTHVHVSSYEGCPRRYFYTHVLGIGTARRTTPFERTHSCIYSFIDWLAGQRVNTPPTLDAAHAAFEEIWMADGPTESAYAADYRKLAGGLVEQLIKAGAGRRFREAEPLAINYRNGKIIVLPDEIAERDDGVIVVRRVRTGRRSKKEFGKLEYALLHRAVVERFGAGAAVEAVHPSDTGVEDVPAPKNAAKNDATVEEILADINAGKFPPDQDSFRCPRCPHFFICAATPDGPLSVA